MRLTSSLPPIPLFLFTPRQFLPGVVVVERIVLIIQVRLQFVHAAVVATRRLDEVRHLVDDRFESRFVQLVFRQ
jgi:hypothetical protein